MANKSTFKLSDFKASIKSNGVARNTRFELIVYPPLMVTSVVNSREISIRCNTGSLPHMKATTKDYHVGQGQMRKMPIGYDQGHELDFSFYNDTNGTVYDGLLQWSKAILASKEENDYSLNYYDQYTGALEVKQLDEQDNVRYAYFLYDVYPTLVEAVTFNSSEIDTAQIVKIRFSYRYARTMDDVLKDELVSSIEKNRDITTLMSQDYITRSRAFDQVSTSNGDGASRNKVYSSDEFESDMIETATRAKGEGLTPSQMYAQCLNLAVATRTKGNGLASTQTAWGSSTTANMNAAIATGNTSTISSEWGATQNSYGQVTSATNSFFSDSASSVYQFDLIKESIPVADPLHTEMSSLTTTYNTVAENQSNINTTYNNYANIVSNIIAPPPVVLMG